MIEIPPTSHGWFYRFVTFVLKLSMSFISREAATAVNVHFAQKRPMVGYISHYILIISSYGGLYIPLYPIIMVGYISQKTKQIYIYILNAIQITIIYVFCFLLKLRQFLGIPWTHRISLEQKNLGFTMTKPCKWYWVGKNNNPQNGTCLWFMKHINDSYTTLYYQFVEEHYYIMTLMTVPQ